VVGPHGDESLGGKEDLQRHSLEHLRYRDNDIYIELNWSVPQPSSLPRAALFPLLRPAHGHLPFIPSH
jgi:hypothetical protein